MRLLLIGAAVFLAAWFTVLKPGGAEEALPPVAAANTTQPAATPAGATTTEAPADENTNVAAVAIPAEVLSKLPKDVAKAIKARKTVVLGVFTDDDKSYRPMADDDRYVRNALKKTNRYKGQVFAKNIGVAKLVDYAPLVNDLQVRQTPAVVVIDRNLKGTVLTGYVDRIAINQAIADARRDSIDPYITDSYLQQANDVCERFNLHESRFSLPTVRGKKLWQRTVKRWNVMGKQYIKAVKKLETPAKWKSLETLWVRTLKEGTDSGTKVMKAVIDDDYAAYLKAMDEWDAKYARKLDRRFNTVGLTACALDRRS
ncbi:hypothetical protein OJ997_00745 [Solirubrobacter phytolaccae]|uniref:Thioredoxin domain-containing protein n=1 Tax=Solirubrobacter phytolaccae TaxID=1404360 RepID=A0A9X3S755_9ACTN|nr:hypothetical protein [Solirubrobacter phytolaccae]MDA0178806.1 hypothetical protein [Solirubrobacter phytolaccae]